MKTYDPIEAFMLGFLFGPMRTIIGLIVIFGAFLTCAAVGGNFEGSAEESAMIFLSIFLMLIIWCSFGTWAVVGLAGCLAMCGGLYAFVVTDSPKVWFYVMATGALVYSAPLVFDGPWWWIAITFLVITWIYWYLPNILARRAKKTNK